MDIQILNDFPLSIKAQLKRQIISMIAGRKLAPGQPLLSAKEMGIFLNINRNTVALAYKELESQGYLTIIKGSGTFVAAAPRHKNLSKLKSIFKKAIQDAERAGFSNPVIVDEFITCLLESSLNSRTAKKVILVDCNYEILETLDTRLKHHIPVDTHQMLIQDIQALPEKFIRRARENDLILCGMNHLEELNSAIPSVPTPLIGFMIRTDFQIINRIMQLPPGTTVGYCCISEKSSTAFFRSSLFPTGTRLTRYHAGISDTAALSKMVAECDIIFATHYVFEQLIKMFPNARHIHQVNLDIDSQNLDYILSCLNKERPHDGQLS
jgi:GntR family transcriptional regulator